jgi:hypothetical protein
MILASKRGGNVPNLDSVVPVYSFCYQYQYSKTLLSNLFKHNMVGS